MIDIKEKKDCCGCSACVQICPKHCIHMVADNEGFLYPQVDTTVCIDCGLCEKVCPVINQNEPREPLAVYAAKNNNDEIRIKSSSGGIFTLLAEKIINEGGVVFGAKFNKNWDVVHDYTETINGLEAFRGSKYVQSIIGDNFKIAKQFLNDGRKVLFSGTPCQIAGLKRYLQKEYNNLLTIDIICHGVPSISIWGKYKNKVKQLASYSCRDFASTNNKLSTLNDINFRDKTNGWKHYMCTYSIVNVSSNQTNRLTFEHTKDPYMQLFLSNYSLRPSCYYCPAKAGKSLSNMTLGDCWGIKRMENSFDDNKGVGVCVIHNNNELLDIVLRESQCVILPSNYLNNFNRSYYISSSAPNNRQAFYDEFLRTDDIMSLAKLFVPPKRRIKNIIDRIIRMIKRTLYN